MRWPLVSRSAFEEVSRQRDELRRQLYRWQDIVAKQNWNHQINDTLPIAATLPELPVESVPEAQATEEEMDSEYRREQAQLAAIARTRKSQLPAALARVMQSRLVRRAQAAVAKPAVVPDAKQAQRQSVAERFEQLKAETLKSIH